MSVWAAGAVLPSNGRSAVLPAASARLRRLIVRYRRATGACSRGRSSLEQREYLEALWSEIRELPDNQRTALLLNLRDSVGSNALTLFLLLNVADVTEMARVVGLSVEQLNDLWSALPLDDLTIAGRLKLTRQQVINLRRAARMRLARRMAKMK